MSIPPMCNNNYENFLAFHEENLNKSQSARDQVAQDLASLRSNVNFLKNYINKREALTSKVLKTVTDLKPRIFELGEGIHQIKRCAGLGISMLCMVSFYAYYLEAEDAVGVLRAEALMKERHYYGLSQENVNAIYEKLAEITDYDEFTTTNVLLKYEVIKNITQVASFCFLYGNAMFSASIIKNDLAHLIPYSTYSKLASKHPNLNPYQIKRLTQLVESAIMAHPLSGKWDSAYEAMVRVKRSSSSLTIRNQNDIFPFHYNDRDKSINYVSKLFSSLQHLSCNEAIDKSYDIINHKRFTF